jgi:hypothetical protein
MQAISAAVAYAALRPNTLTILLGMIQQIHHGLPRQNAGMDRFGQIGEGFECAFVFAGEVELLGDLFAEGGGSSPGRTREW